MWKLNQRETRQYPMPLEAKKGITPHIRRLLDLGSSGLCGWSGTHPCCPMIKKPHTNDYTMVQDLQETNMRAIDIYPTVPNLYTLPNSMPLDWQ